MSSVSRMKTPRGADPRGAMLADERGSRSRAVARLLRLLVGIDQFAGLVFRRREHGLVVHALPGLALFDAVVLHLHHAGLGPLAARAVGPVAHDGLEGVLAVVIRNLVVLDALGAGDRLAQSAEI